MAWGSRHRLLSTVSEYVPVFDLLLALLTRKGTRFNLNRCCPTSILHATSLGQELRFRVPPFYGVISVSCGGCACLG